MSTVIINPLEYKDQYLEYLNKCFPNWGNKNTYDWVFERKVGENKMDFIILKNDENQVIAGSAITYRVLKLENGSTINFGIMTGSWTLPEARGKGCFSQIIEESKRICFSKNVPFLTAFVTETNASFRRLKDAGFYCKIADNVFSSELPFSTNTNFLLIEKLPIDNQLYEEYLSNSATKTVFAYSKQEFENQFINRINKTECIKINHTIFLFEETENIIKLLFVSNNDIENIRYFCDYLLFKKHKKTMFFQSGESEILKLIENNFHFAKGYFTVQKTDESIAINEDVFKNICVNLGDKM